MKSNYSNTIYAFDIETTTTPGHITTHYLSSFKSVDFQYYKKSVNEIVKNISPPTFCRTADDINDYLIALNDKAKKQKEIFIIFVHNLAYEANYLLQNIDFVKNNYSNENALFIKTRIPLFIRIENIEFRCSYKLLNKSLQNVGLNLGFNKLEIDYTKQYFEFSELPPNEYEYNERDVDITLAGVLTECAKWEYIHSVKDIPFTSTGFTRHNNTYINGSVITRAYSGLCNYQKEFTKEYVDFLESIFQGGYTHANAFFVNRPLKNVASFDIVSSYIDTILHRKFPHFFKEYYGNKLRFLKWLFNKNDKEYIEIIKNYSQPFSAAYMAHITLANVHAKILKNKNLILPISASKCDAYVNIIVDNGRIYKADSVSIFVNEIDLYIISRFYNFKIVNCDKLYYTYFFRDMPEYVTNATHIYLDEKTINKRILHKYNNGDEINKSDFYNSRINEYIYSEETIESILNLSDDDKKRVLNDNLRVSKNRLNSMYGINVQKLIQPDIKYNIDDDTFSTEEGENVNARILMRDFTKGLYITSYSRLNLFCFGLYLINNTKTTLIYSDTDSWKCYGDIDNTIKVNERYNKLVESIVNNSLDYNVGYFEYESTYKYFATLGCKKYIVAEADKITVTIAGVNKFATSDAFTELYKSLLYDFPLLCKIAFKPNTILSYTITNKKVAKYDNTRYNTIVTDENGKSGKITGVNIVELCDSDYMLMDYYKASVTEYIDFVENLQHNHNEITPAVIYRDNNGVVKWAYTTEYDNDLLLYETNNILMENVVI